MKRSIISTLILASAVVLGASAANARVYEGHGSAPSIYDTDSALGQFNPVGQSIADCGHAGQAACDVGNVPQSVFSRGGMNSDNSVGSM